VQFDCSFEAPFRTVMEVVGETASLVVTQPFKPGAGAQLLLSHGDRTEALDVPTADLYIGEVEDLADAVLHGKPPRVSLADSRGNVAAIVALLESARLNRPVRIG
jgi:predicted dehydrogenase